MKSGQPEVSIVDAIATHDTQFHLSSAGLQALSQAGVSSKVIRAMVAAESKKKQAAEAGEFYAYDNEKTQGTVHLYVAKDTGLPLRIEMGEPNSGGGVQMNYSELSTPVNIEIHACMSGQ